MDLFGVKSKVNAQFAIMEPSGSLKRIKWGGVKMT